MSVDASGGSAALVWQVHGQASLHWRRWQDEWTVFNAASGQTHLMDPLTTLAVMTLELGPASARQIAVQLSDESLVPHSADAERVLGDVLSRLAAADLIEPARG